MPSTQRSIFCCSIASNTRFENAARVLVPMEGGTSTQGAGGDDMTTLFSSVRFTLAGFDQSEENQFIDALEQHGGINVGRYAPECSHVIVSQLTWDAPICASARKDGKILATKSWVTDCLELGALMDTSSVLYMPLRNPSGIPGSNKFCICLTGYQGQMRREIMRMVEMMGASFTKPLIASKVSHLICYKFEGDKYKLAKHMGLKLVNHRWLEECLKSWTLLEEKNYVISGWELELAEAEAKDSEDSQDNVQRRLSKEEANSVAGDTDQKAVPEADQETAKSQPQNRQESIHGKEEVEQAEGNKQDSPIKGEAGQAASAAGSYDSEATTQHYDVAELENCSHKPIDAPFDLCEDYRPKDAGSHLGSGEQRPQTGESSPPSVGRSIGGKSPADSSKNQLGGRDKETPSSSSKKRKSYAEAQLVVLDAEDDAVQQAAAIPSCKSPENVKTSVGPSPGHMKVSSNANTPVTPACKSNAAEKSTTFAPGTGNKKLLRQSVGGQQQRSTEKRIDNEDDGGFMDIDIGRSPLRSSSEKLQDPASCSRRPVAVDNVVTALRKSVTAPKGEIVDIDSVEVITSDEVKVMKMGSPKHDRAKHSKEGEKPSEVATSARHRSPSETRNRKSKKSGTDTSKPDIVIQIDSVDSEIKINGAKSPDWTSQRKKQKKSYKTYASKKKASRETSSSTEQLSDYKSVRKVPHKLVANGRKDKQYWFALSGHNKEKSRFHNVIKKLKGHVCRDGHSWKDQATHFVASPLRRTEKFFAAAAAGRWILKSEYLEASEKAGTFVDEEEHEWHGPGFNDEGTIDLEAPRRWRLSKKRYGGGAFQGMRVLTYGECIIPPLETLERAIKAGGGIVLATSAPYNQHLVSGVDFAIISLGIPQDDPCIVEFIKHGVACVRDEFFVEFICKPSSSLDKHVLYNTGDAVQAALERIQRMKTSAASDLRDSRPPPEDPDEIACVVCNRVDGDEVMLLCGDGQGRGCGVATHTYCCDPALAEVPEEDWFCSRCSMH